MYIDEASIQAKIDSFENLLLPWKDLWSAEPLSQVGFTYSDEIENFLDRFQKLPLNAHYSGWLEAEVKKNFPQWKSLAEYSYLRPIHSFSKLRPFPKQKKMNQKKWHEIQSILQLLIKQNEVPTHLYDCAGGQGLFSYEFLNQFECAKCTLIERNSYLTKIASQQTAQFDHRLTLITEDLKKITFSNCCNGLWLGLHACGDLSDLLINEIPPTHRFYVIGCCYHQTKKSFPNFTNEALTLAARAEGKLSYQSLLERLRVKQYRYGLELGLNQISGKKMSLVLKSFPSNLYHRSFADYLKEAALRWKGEINLMDPEVSADLIDYQKSESFHKEFSRLFLLGLLRHFFARPLEVYLAYLRLFSLSQRYRQKVPDLTEIFQQEISPRNILISNRLDI